MTAHKRRTGFTLVELLVVIALAAVLISLVAAVIPSSADRRSYRGAEAMRGWLETAKQRAFRDRQLRGLRIETANEMTYIEQPENLVGIGTTLSTPMVNYNANATTLSGTTSVTLPLSVAGQVQPGDHLELMDTPDQPYRITAVAGTALTLANRVSVAQKKPTDPAAAMFYNTQNWRIIRQARPLAGEPVLLMPKEIGILTISDGNTTATPVFDILFGPSGQVFNQRSSRIFLVVGDTTPGGATAVERTVIAIHCRTGQIGSYPFDPGADPFSFAKRGVTPE
jgi:prepilin-type N-terminal cleavage/methylation domain-containing protein